MKYCVLLNTDSVVIYNSSFNNTRFNQRSQRTALVSTSTTTTKSSVQPAQPPHSFGLNQYSNHDNVLCTTSTLTPTHSCVQPVLQPWHTPGFNQYSHTVLDSTITASLSWVQPVHCTGKQSSVQPVQPHRYGFNQYSTILYVKLITFHGLYDKLSTNIQRQLGQYERNPSSDTQGWFRSLHQALGQLVEFPIMFRWMNITVTFPLKQHTIISLVSSSFSDEQNDQWKRSLQESGYLIGPHAITLRIVFRWKIQSFSS